MRRYAPIILVALCALLLLALLDRGGIAGWFQSPLSPLAAEASPIKAVPNEPLRAPRSQTQPSVATLWSRPLPWILVGIPLFGGLAAALIVLLSRLKGSK